MLRPAIVRLQEAGAPAPPPAPSPARENQAGAAEDELPLGPPD